MAFVDVDAAEAEVVSAVVRESFSASEGEAEGALIGVLAARLLAETAPGDIHAFAAREGGAIVGAIVFSRMRYAGDPHEVFILSPLAIATHRQGQGMGQALIRHGLAALKARGAADVALTYGDPAYYGRVGFRPVTTADVPAPFPLSHPHGWLGQALDGAAFAPLQGPVACVPALADPVFW